MTTVAQILAGKPDSTPYTIGPDATIREAATLMTEKNIGSLIVAENGKIIGIVTERDYARKIASTAFPCGDVYVRDLMTSPVLAVRPDHTTGECMALITEHRLRHLPVVNDGKLVGMMSIGDLVKDVISAQQFTIEQLEHYIMGDLL